MLLQSQICLWFKMHLKEADYQRYYEKKLIPRIIFKEASFYQTPDNINNLRFLKFLTIFFRISSCSYTQRYLVNVVPSTSFRYKTKMKKRNPVKSNVVLGLFFRNCAGDQVVIQKNNKIITRKFSQMFMKNTYMSYIMLIYIFEYVVYTGLPRKKSPRAQYYVRINLSCVQLIS